ncbi:hypothetical protein HWB99_gp025 [Mycobacterium phage DrLupo]|uniref:Uncharacterized protein n=1 Tax=Mycobacterium phage DrLupo TaxID=2499037 RepID=A0A3S9UQJ2_9CAUD|nr:hypothetical protein HWB99_gp025 [Mycobacterium phage DrLupo]AZS12561.1 hypothetical protein SEA_DRLUPO_25 [Mycobacterium phage DrLupo]
MAEQSAIDAVKLQLADEANDLGITDVVIGGWLDSGLTETKTILAGWRAIAAKSAATEDVSESGSSRTIRLHERAIEMIRDWQSRADAEDKATMTDPLGRGRFASHRITRV